MKYFVSSDIHGFYDEWITALNEKGFDIKNPNHKIIICGDLFDRGKKPKEIINFILLNQDKFILIKGNHEELMENMILRNEPVYVDFHNGTVDTILSLYPNWQILEFDLYKISRRTGLEDVLLLCKDYYETDNYIFVHGWIPINESTFTYDKNWRKASREKWNKARWLNPLDMYKNKIFEPNKKIVCGHYRCSAFWHFINPQKFDSLGGKARFSPFIDENIVALDAFTFESKKVNVVVIED